MASPQQEALAKQNGFHNYDEMLLWYKQRSAPHTGTIAGASAPAQPAQPTQQAPNNAMHGGVAGILDYVRRAMGGQ